MADRNIDESIRKPRRAKGTPYYRIRGYYILGLFGLSGLSWILFENWDQTKKLKQKIREGKFENSAEDKLRILEFQIGRDNPQLIPILEKLREKQKAEDQIPREQSRLSKLLGTLPDV